MPKHDPAQLVARFEAVAQTRMVGLPLVNAALRVEAVGFQHSAPFGDEDPGWLGVLVTPWSMNLLWWPDEDANVASAGEMRWRTLGPERYLFTGVREEGLDGFEMCSLFSPMFEFADAAAARAVAMEAMRQLDQTLERARAAAAAQRLDAPARRDFLRGRFAAR